MEAIAQILRDALAGAGVDLSGLPDVALVGGAGGAALVVLLILFMLIGAIAGGGKKKREAAEAREEREARQRPAPAREPAKARTPEPQKRAPEAKKGKGADPIQTMQRDAAASSERVRRGAEELKSLLVAERDRAAAAEAPFAVILPTEALRLVAEALAGSEEPALAAARRKLGAKDFDGVRADLRRHAETKGGTAAWRDLGAAEALKDLAKALEAFEKAHQAGGADFVTLVALRRLYSGVGRPADGRVMAKAAVEAARNDRERAIAFDELGENCMQEGDDVGGRAAYEQGLHIVRKLAEQAPGDMGATRDLAVSYFKLASAGGRRVDEFLAGAVAAFEKMEAARALDASDAEALNKLRAALKEREAAQKKD